MIKVISLIFIILFLNILTISSYHFYIQSDFSTLEKDVMMVNAGQLNLYGNKVNIDADVSISGYLVDHDGKYFILPSVAYVNIEPLFIDSLIVEVMDINNDFSFVIDNKCLNRNVVVNGMLDKKLSFRTIKTDAIRTVELGLDQQYCFIQKNNLEN